MRTFLHDIREETLQYYDSLVAATPRLVTAIVILVITWVLARMVKRASGKRLRKQMEDPLLAEFLATMIRTVIVITGLLFALKTLGFGGITASILAGAGITAFIIGFALRDIGENFLAGILMAFKRPFRVGDFVESGPVKGKVLALNIRDTQIKTPDGKDVFVPNANIIKNPLINYTIDGFLRFDFRITLPGNTDYEKAAQAILNAVRDTEGVLKKRRQPSVDITGIGAGNLEATVSFWIDTFRTKEKQETILTEVIKKTHHQLASLKKEQ